MMLIFFAEKLKLDADENTVNHTPGCMIWIMQLTDYGKKNQVVIIGSVIVNPGYKLISNKTYPNIVKDYEHAITTLKSLECDIVIFSSVLIMVNLILL